MNTTTERALPPITVPVHAKAAQLGAWVATGLFAAMFGLSGAMFIAGPPEIVAQIRHLGYPDYFRQLLGVAKLLGVIALVLPLPNTTALREWAYAGFTFVCVAALASHLMSGDPLGKAVPAGAALGLLASSYFLRRRAARANIRVLAHEGGNHD